MTPLYQLFYEVAFDSAQCDDLSTYKVDTAAWQQAIEASCPGSVAALPEDVFGSVQVTVNVTSQPVRTH